MSLNELEHKPKFAPDYAMDNLARHLMKRIKGLTAYAEWPYATQKLKYPTITLTCKTQTRTPLNPVETVSKTAPDANGMLTAYLAMAEWNMTWQLDLWASDKLMRSEISQRIMDEFLSLDIPASTPGGLIGTREDNGLRLKLDDYYGAWCAYEIQDSQTIDDEQAAQRQERRTKMNLIVNLREIRPRSYYAIKKVQVQSVVSESVEPSVPQPSDAGISEVFSVPK